MCSYDESKSFVNLVFNLVGLEPMDSMSILLCRGKSAGAIEYEYA